MKSFIVGGTAALAFISLAACTPESKPTKPTVATLPKATPAPTPTPAVSDATPPPDATPKTQAAPHVQYGDLPTAKAVADKPGFVISPYAPTQGYVDVKGLPPGTEVKCPFTGKIFLVP